MNRQELKHYRDELLKLSSKLEEELASDQRGFQGQDELDPGNSIPSAERRIDAGAQEVELGLIANNQYLQAEVVAALDRIDCGDFGMCEECGRKIARTRLDALPYARTCVHCAKFPKPIAG